jgi:hypothetical protein
MFSPYIDKYWHSLIANNQITELVHDTSVFSITPVSIQWIPLYENQYGKLDKVWFMDFSGQIIEQSYRAYLTNRNIRMPFNCAGRSQ